ncbi:helix-turn-helix transcriptional regulator [Salmonella enterica subsp. enterica serovar 4,[5],12:i:-]|jgi:transcriptional regulator with XRE-family HTH domain|uniref:helix-turn-helix domain-containing protein n=1 Tax=Enterobacterales TaxID=91347 RepID=UPI00039130C1|nr:MULTISPECIES: helix-turn-helix domain-containing protein [Enterobacterales]EAU9606639.1 XRE family transcriptional regulator [Salmonella enterica]ECD6229095.1 XRE family transcriptional regulator [Salmonella enterica subsp. enterica serovar Indiana]EDD7544275.1 helix-turn-helix domain-containing protein [Salmonella enterica subsp. enterica serovar Enteritidis]EHC5134417.1 helix-turn-helix transcriptional regulator [Salmonella enterica subsp. enterica serovar 4,[5],12:i:-]EJM6416822.1 helix-
MGKEIRAERIKNVILENSTYEELAEKTGISVSTLVRIASGKTEPKFSDIIKIAMVTGVDLNELAHGDIVNIKEDAMLKNDEQNDEVVKAHNFIVWNISSLDKKDILSISRMVYALSTLKKKS